MVRAGRVYDLHTRLHGRMMLVQYYAVGAQQAVAYMYFMYSAVSWLSAPRIDKHSDEADKELHIYINRFILSLKLFRPQLFNEYRGKVKGQLKPAHT